MKKHLVHTENILKDKIQGHEFPFDPDAWSSMQQLLDQSASPAENLYGSPRSKQWSAVSITRWVGYFGVLALLLVVGKYHAIEAIAETKQSLGTLIEESTHTEGQKFNEIRSQTQNLTQNESITSPISEVSVPVIRNNDGKREAKTSNITVLETDITSVFEHLTEDSDHPVIEREDAKYYSSLIYQLLGVKPMHSTFESIDDFHVPEDAVQIPSNILEAYKNESVPENYRTDKARSQPILLPKIEGWQDRVKKAKPIIPLKSPQAAIIKKAGKHIQLGLLLGGQAMSLERSRRDTRLQPTVGISLSAPLLGKRLSAEIDIMWKNVSGYHFYASFADSGYAKGGYSRWEYSVASEKINFFEIPVAIKYSTAHQKQNLMAGVRLSRVKPNDYIQYFSASNANQAMEDYIGDIGDGFHRWDAALFLGADVRLWKNLWLDIRYSRGLHDLTDNAYFKNSRVDIASDTQITLKYNFAKLRIPSR